MAGFRSETESGVKSAFSGIAKIAGAAIVGAGLFEFAKSTITDAAKVQKSVELIKAEFGGASKAVLDFSDKAGIALGVAAHTSDQAAARFGLLFHNLGLGKAQSAKMTEGLLKLGATISAVRGTNPDEVFQSLPLALAGNVRGLKQLGFAFSQQQFQAEAFKLHLTSAINQGLTPAQRAVAIYSLVTAKLGELQKQAAAHSGDLLNVTRRLSAEWDQAKEKLGTALLPALAGLIGFLADKLPSAVAKATTLFHDFADTAVAVGKFVAPAFRPLVTAFDAIKQAFGKGGGGVDELRAKFAKLSPIAKAAAVAIAALGVAMLATFVSVAPITATIVAVVALGAGLDEAYKHSAKFREIVQSLKTWLEDKLVPALKHLAEKLTPTFAAAEKTIKKVFNDIVVIFGVFVKWGEAIWAKFGGTIKKIVGRDFNAALRIIKDVFKIIGLEFDAIKNLVTGKWGALWNDLKKIVSTEADIVVTQVKTLAKDVEDVFDGIWHTVEQAALEGLAKFTSILAKIPTGFKLFGHFIGIHNPFGKITDELNGKVAAIKAEGAAKDLAKAVADNTAKALRVKTNDPTMVIAATELGKTVKQKVKDAVTTGANAGTTAATLLAADAAANAAIANAKTKLNDLKQNLSLLIAQTRLDIDTAVRDAKNNLITIGGSLADQVGQIIDQPFVVAQQKIQDAQDRIALIYDTKNAKLQAQSRQLTALQNQLSAIGDKRALQNLRNEIALPGGHQLSTDPKKAVAQLQALAKGANALNRPAIEAFILQYRGALLQVAQDKLGLKTSALDAKHTAQTTALGLKTDQLQIQQDVASKMKRIAQRQINDLVVELSSGAIKLKTFTKRLATVLGTTHANFKTAGALLGAAFATGFQANLDAITKQALAIAAGPKRAGSGLEPQITRPALVAAKDHLKVARAHAAIAGKQLDVQRKIAKAAQTTAKNTALLKSLPESSNNKNPGHKTKHAVALAGSTG